MGISHGFLPCKIFGGDTSPHPRRVDACVEATLFPRQLLLGQQTAQLQFVTIASDKFPTNKGHMFALSSCFSASFDAISALLYGVIEEITSACLSKRNLVARYWC